MQARFVYESMIQGVLLFFERLTLKQVIITVALFSFVLRSLFTTLAYWRTVESFDSVSHPLMFVEQDSTIYSIIALNLLQGNGYTHVYSGEPNTDTLFRQTPLYAFMLYPLYQLFGLGDVDMNRLHPENEAARRIFIDHKPVVIAAVVINHLLGILTALLVCLIIHSISRSSLNSLVGGLLFSTSVVKLITDNVMLPDCLQVFFVTAALACFLRFYNVSAASRWLALSALCLGLGALSKPAGALLWVFFIAVIATFTQLSIRKKVVLCFMYFAIANFGPACWLVRNGMLTGTYEYTSQGDYLVLNHWANRTLQVKSGLDFSEYIHSKMPKDLEMQAVDRIHRAGSVRGYPLNQAERDAYYREVGLEVILKNWPWYLQAHALGLVEELLRAPGYRIRWFEHFTIMICLVGATLSGWYLLKKRQYGHLFLMVTPLLYYFSIIPPAPPGNLRYKILWLPFLFILAFAADMRKAMNRLRSH